MSVLVRVFTCRRLAAMQTENKTARELEGKPSRERGNSDHRLKWTDILDVTAKLIGALAVVFAGIVAN